MNILIITETANHMRGYGRFCGQLVSHLKKRYPHDIRIQTLVLRGESVFGDEKAVLIRNRKLGFFINPFIILWYARGYSLIHCLDGYPFGLYGAVVKIVTGKKLFISMMGTYSVEPLYHFDKAILMKWAYRYADTLTAISHFTKNEVLKIIPDLDIGVITPGVDCNIEPMDSSDAPIIPERYILTVGTLSERKGYHVSLRAFAKVKKKFPNLRYVIVGSLHSNEYRALLEKIIQEENISQNVIFLKNLSDAKLSRVYRHADIFILTALNIEHHFEGYGMVYVEAGCYSIPVIGTFGSGAEDAIQNGKTGMLVPQGDIQAAADALMMLLGDPLLREKMAQGSNRFAQKKSWANIVLEYFKIYKNLI